MTRVFVLVALTYGCALRRSTAPAPSPMPPPSDRASATNDVVPPRVSSAPSAGSASGYVFPEAPPRTTEAPEDVLQREADITRWQERLRVAEGALASSVVACRVICAAAADVCAAAHEICRLTGDADARSPHDLRCARARGSCAEASRRREGTCPVCPPR